MNVLFLGPTYPPEMHQYTRGLYEVGAKVYGVADTPKAGLTPELKKHIHDYLQVPRIMDDEDVMKRVLAWVKGKKIHAVWTNWEPLIMCAAKLREALDQRREAVGDRVVIGAQRPDAHGSNLEQAGFQNGLQQRRAERVEIGTRIQIGRIFDGQMRHRSSPYAFSLTC